MTLFRKFTRGLVLAAMLLAAPGLYAESGAALKPDAIRAEPYSDARSVGKLAVGDKVEIVTRKGGWMQIKSARGNGWVRMLSIRRGEARKTSTTGELAGLLGMASGRAGTGKVVATTGVRGLSEEELKSAKYDEGEIKLLHSYTTSRAEAQSFAAQGKLVPREMDYLPEPGPQRRSELEQGENIW